jgi:hypothetical protein
VGVVNSERAEAYGRVMQIVSAEGTEQLEPDEQSELREAADALFFSTEISGDPEARDALAHVNDLATRLIEAERWSADYAEQVLRDFEACGPAQLVRLGR